MCAVQTAPSPKMAFARRCLRCLTAQRASGRPQGSELGTEARVRARFHATCGGARDSGEAECTGGLNIDGTGRRIPLVDFLCPDCTPFCADGAASTAMRPCGTSVSVPFRISRVLERAGSGLGITLRFFFVLFRFSLFPFSLFPFRYFRFARKPLRNVFCGRCRCPHPHSDGHPKITNRNTRLKAKLKIRDQPPPWEQTNSTSKTCSPTRQTPHAGLARSAERQ